MVDFEIKEVHIIRMDVMKYAEATWGMDVNDPDEFEGGEFEFQTGKNPEKVPLVKGSVVFFPSFFLHRVREITSGNRESLVLWIGGDSYE